MELEVTGPVFEWRGPAPHHFVALPEDDAAVVADVAAAVTYGWGMIPVAVRMGGTRWTTALWPRDGSYVVPLKLAARRAEGVATGDVVDLVLTIDV
ncbi:DUF1905 domain-containing protein [Nocardioides sp. zg-579]|uniref:DUF1905 domain-containing protein n=1 Tax=Nocardioides marmotae TaxID=2663857 RepID=A0A6I3JAU7_9ACTN|nr:DUF1905 domain-containing protein [Nocardioides marmotae]MCR6031591.1 DUF1905 domain-containing protein [Gordonia jinghuaiqii]MTB95230.1 DUF1905 domain-containing protein [Nocardioides marmotae]QKE02294.1 DUF1905 domain-containing protein [Nocardioides marmotae]